MKSIICLITFVLPVLLWAGDLNLTVLDNGLTIYTQEDHAKPLISLFAIVDGGSRTETPELAGLSHFYEHLIARGGSKKQKETEFRRRMSSLGEERIYTYDDGTAYGFTVPTENFPEAIWRYTDFLMDLKPDSASIAKERTIVMEEYKMSVADSPEGRCYELALQSLFTRHPYFPSTIGLPEVIQTATYEKLRTFYEERYTPNQIVMVVVGDFDTAQMLGTLKEQFGHYQPGKISFEAGVIEPEQSTFRQIADSMAVSSSYGVLAYRLPPLADADVPALRVLSMILGQASNSRLDQALKIKENLVLGIYAYPDFMRDSGVLYLSWQCSPENEATVIEKLFAEIAQLAAAGVSAEELEAAKEKLISNEILANQTYMGKAQNLCHYAIAEAVSLAAQTPALVRAVSAAEVQQAAQRYLNASRANLAQIVPKGQKIHDYAPLAQKYAVSESASAAAPQTMKTQQNVLPNGLTLILREDHAAPTACVGVFVKGGQWLEGAGKAGVAYLTASLLDKGTQEFSREALMAQKEKLGINLWCGALEDYSQIVMNGTATKLMDGLKLVDQVVFKPTFPEAEFAKAKEDQLQAIQAVEDQPWEYTHREALHDLYQKSPYRNLVIGRAEDVERLSRQDALDYYQRAFAPANVTVVVVGDFKAEELLASLTQLGQQQPRREAPKIALLNDPAPQQKQERLVYKEKDQNTFNYSFLTVGVSHPDYLPLVLAKRMLSTRLFYKWIYDQGIAYRMWTRMFPRLGQARFYFEMGVSEQNYPTAKQGILADLHAYLDQPLDADELELAKQDEITRHLMTFQDNEGIANGLGSWEALGLGYQFFEDFPAKLRAVKAADVQRVAKKYLNPQKVQFVNVGAVKE